MSPEVRQTAQQRPASQAARAYRAAAVSLALVLLCAAGGCRVFSPKLSASQLDKGYTLVLPGVLGHAPWDNNLAAGLADAGVPGAIEVYDWTHGPLLWGYNVLSNDHQRKQGDKVAAKIIDYQKRYPGRPVHLVGHSGGAWTAICALETMPPEARITKAVLLAPGMPMNYDLRKAMSHTTAGIHNFYSPYDMLLSAMFVPTQVAHAHTNVAAAGAFGFETPPMVQGAERQWYERSLKQHPFEAEMFEDGNLGDHFGWTHPTFVAQWVAPVIMESMPDVRRLPQLGPPPPGLPQPSLPNANGMTSGLTQTGAPAPSRGAARQAPPFAPIVGPPAVVPVGYASGGAYGSDGYYAPPSPSLPPRFVEVSSRQ
jgi:pimeloyl-ACP methyl ester carboxylesterase